jgi:hypothetical protein
VKKNEEKQKNNLDSSAIVFYPTRICLSESEGERERENKNEEMNE